MYYVYDLVNSEGQTLYVGYSKHPAKRLYEHTKAKPDGKGQGKFYGQTLDLELIDLYPTRKEAWHAEGQRKLSLGLEWTERDAPHKGGSNSTGGCTSGPKATCPNCHKEYYAKGLARHLTTCT